MRSHTDATYSINRILQLLVLLLLLPYDIQQGFLLLLKRSLVHGYFVAHCSQTGPSRLQLELSRDLLLQPVLTLLLQAALLSKVSS